MLENNIEKLWNLWSSDQQILCCDLIKSQGLTLYDVIVEFWESFAKRTEDKFKSLNITPEGTVGPQECGMVFFDLDDEEVYSVYNKNQQLHYAHIFPDRYVRFSKSYNKIQCNSIEEAKLKCIEKFIEYINIYLNQNYETNIN